MAKRKSKYPVVLRARVPESFKARLDAILVKRGYGDHSELLREAMIRFIKDEERMTVSEAHKPVVYGKPKARRAKPAQPQK